MHDRLPQKGMCSGSRDFFFKFCEIRDQLWAQRSVTSMGSLLPLPSLVATEYFLKFH